MKNRFKNFSAQKKLDLSMQLYFSARELKRAWLKKLHPDWSDAELNEEVKRIFLNART
ncbi:MAG: hypothetical protein HND52_11700 [Ignavibacteriae bacterium]|nr:hypothetical protein [Ignavibacteriota bacterium]